MATPGTKPTILIVDDNPDMCDLLTTMFMRSGHLAVWVPGGQQALDLLETCQPRVVLLDLMMPGISGLDVLKRIRANQACRDVRVLVYSALSNPQKQREVMEAGADQFIVKGMMDYGTLETIVKLYIQDLGTR